MSYMRNKFEQWLSFQKQKSGSTYSSKTVQNYSASLKSHASKLKGISLKNYDLFTIDNLEEFDRVYEMIISSKNFNEVNNSANMTFSSALQLYRRFLEDTELNNIAEHVSFEEWLNNHPNKYISSTIKKYIKALNKADEWLNIDIPCKILEIDNITLFQKIQNQIKSAANYADVNHNHGHGDLSAALALYEKYLNDINNSNQITEEPEAMEMTVKEKIDRIKAYIAGKGFTYDSGLIENFWLSLKSKPFVILAGTSGTGKTRLVKLFAEAIKAEYRMVPVRPDWSDSSDLLGHTNLNGEYNFGDVLEFIMKAQQLPNKPYILCLDEMNLARVEYYLSDFLSVIETRDFKDGKIISDQLLQNNVFEGCEKIIFPENFYLVGTVNMDETTFPFSKKVLDRANTIEFNTVDLMPSEEAFDTDASPIDVSNDFLKSEYLFLSQCLAEENRDLVESVCSDLETINQVLKTNNAHVGYRVRDEIVFYMLNNEKAGLLSRDEAMDNAIMQKILPRIQGSSASVKDMLCELFKIFAEDFTGIQTENNDTASQMLRSIETKGSKYPKSAEKIAFMVRRFDEDGFTSYWL